MPRLANRARRRVLAKKLEVSRRSEDRYVRALRAIFRELHAEAVAFLLSRRDGIFDDFFGLMKGAMEKAAAKVASVFTSHAKTVNAENRKAIHHVGVKGYSDFRIQDALNTAKDTNVSLVKKAGEDYAEDVYRVFGTSDQENLKEKLEARGEVSEARAELIARDQTLKLNATLTRIRQENAGIREYIWSTCLDERVRDTHREFEGQHFLWAVGSPEGHPGEPINCRCVAIPVMPLEDDGQ